MRRVCSMSTANVTCASVGNGAPRYIHGRGLNRKVGENSEPRAECLCCLGCQVLGDIDHFLGCFAAIAAETTPSFTRTASTATARSLMSYWRSTARLLDYRWRERARALRTTRQNRFTSRVSMKMFSAAGLIATWNGISRQTPSELTQRTVRMGT